MFSAILILLISSYFGSCFEIQPRILNGSESKRGQFPYFAHLNLESSFGLVCGGSLLNDEFILTTAHCLMYRIKIEVHLGSLRRWDSQEKGRLIIPTTSEHFYIHPEYKVGNKTNDIGLIKLPQRVVYSDVIKPISLPIICEVLLDKELTAIGYGANANQQWPDVLQFTKLVTISPTICKDTFDNPDESSIICAEGHTNNSIYFGDTGGPLVDPIDSTVIGIAGSWNLNSTGSNKNPQLFTNVIKFIPWISNITGIPATNCVSSSISTKIVNIF